MPRLDVLTAIEEIVKIPFGRETLTVRFRPGMVTTDLIESLAAADADAGIGEAVLRPLAQLIAGWDLMGDDDQPIGTSVEALKHVPLVVLTRVAEAIASAISTPVARAKQDAAARGRRN